MWAELKDDWAYKDFHFRDITRPQYRHLFLLLFWPVFLPCFFIVERLSVTRGFNLIHCAFDDMIPFCEIFIIPYVIWYPMVALTIVFTAGFDVPVFIRFSKYLMITLTISLIIYLVWPSGHDLWLTEFPRDNILTRITQLLYRLDVNTNICPSEHVTSGFGAVFAAMRTKRLSGKKWMIFFWTEAVLVVLSVVFVKQHSVIDVVAAIPVILVGYMFSFYKRDQGAKTT